MSWTRPGLRALPLALLLAAALLLLAGCAQRMASQGRYKPLEADEFFTDNRSARSPISGTLPLDTLAADSAVATGRENGQFVATVPVTVTDELLLRGRVMLNAYCAPCHGGGLTGNGPAVQAGFPPPPDLFSGDLPSLPVGDLYDTVTHGRGVMPGYAVQMRPGDRWAAVAALRALQQQRAPSQPAPTAAP